MIKPTTGAEYSCSLVSDRTSPSHFFPLWRLNIQRSDANQVDTATNPKQLNAENTVVTVEVILCLKNVGKEKKHAF